MSVTNTSYAREYVVVSKTANMAVLRVVDESLYSTYWKEFISAKVKREVQPMYLRLEQVPPETTLVDQYASFIPELPLVTLEVGDEKVNVTDRITANLPNTEVPGLYRIDYRINLTAEFSSPIWAVYVSIQQRPILRKAAASNVLTPVRITKFLVSSMMPESSASACIVGIFTSSSNLKY